MRTFFRRWWYGEEDHLALDLQDSRLVLAGAAARGNSQYVVDVLPKEVVEGAIRDGQVIDSVALSDMIRRSLPTIETRYSRLGVSLPGRAVLCVALPSDLRPSPLKEDDARDWLFEKLSLSSEEYCITVVSPAGCEDPHNRIVLATRHVVINSWKELARRLRCELVFIAPRACILTDEERGDNAAPTNERAACVDLLDSVPSVHLYLGADLVRTETLSGSGHDDTACFSQRITEALLRESSGPASPLRVRVLGEMSENVLAGLLSGRGAPQNNIEVEFIVDVTLPAQKLLGVLGARI